MSMFRLAARRGLQARPASRCIHASPALCDQEKAAAAPSSPGPLSDIRVQIPLGFIAAIPLLQNQVVILSEETQLLGCFMVFVGTVYSQAGDAIGKMLDAKGEAIIAEHNAQEEVTIKAVKSLIEAHQRKLSLVDDMKLIYSTQSELLSMLAAAKSMELQHATRADIVRKLDYLVQKEEQALASRQAQLADKAAAAVSANFGSDKSLQTKALNEALESIADPNKKAEDLVGKLFKDYFANYSKAVSAATAEYDIPAEVLEEAKAEILSQRKRAGIEDEEVPELPAKFSVKA